MRVRHVMSVAALVTVFAFCGAARGEILKSALSGGQLDSNDYIVNGFSVSSGDLLQTDLKNAEIISGGATYGSSVGALYNGYVAQTQFWSTDGGESFSPLPENNTTDTTTLVFKLDTDTNTKGYDISKIVSVSGYPFNRNTIQAYDVYIKKVGGTTYGFLYGIDSSLSGNNTANQEVQVTVQDTSGILASGVAEIEVAFRNYSGISSGVAAYRELDVFGSATTIPEPSTLSLLSAAMLGLLAYAWRKRK